MKVSSLKLWGAIVLLGTLAMSSAPAEALYRFDDLFGPSGKGAQWMAVTEDLDTGGSPTAVPMETTANFVNVRDSVLLMNGGVQSGDIQTLFLVLPETQGTMLVNFDWMPPYPAPASYTQDVLVDNDFYQVVKAPLGSSSGPKKSFQLDFLKNSAEYESVRGNFIFHQNPNSTPSQTLQVPFIVANVYNGTAEGKPLLFKATIRDASTNTGSGNIVAYDRFDWDVTADKTVGTDNDWVFVPIPKLPIDANTIRYRLSTEVVNYTAIRYALQRYDGYAWTPLPDPLGLRYPGGGGRPLQYLSGRVEPHSPWPGHHVQSKFQRRQRRPGGDAPVPRGPGGRFPQPHHRPPVHFRPGSGKRQGLGQPQRLRGHGVSTALGRDRLFEQSRCDDVRLQRDDAGAGGRGDERRRGLHLHRGGCDCVFGRRIGYSRADDR